MACIPYNKVWESKFVNIVSRGDKLQDINIIQLKLQVHDTYIKDEKLTTNFEAVNDEHVIYKRFLDDKLLKVNGLLSSSEKDYNEFQLQYNEQSVEENSIQRAVKTTMQILYDAGIFDIYAISDKVLEDILFNTRQSS